MWRELRRTVVVGRVARTCGLAAVVAMVLCASALAAGKVVDVATPFDIEPPGRRWSSTQRQRDHRVGQRQGPGRRSRPRAVLRAAGRRDGVRALGQPPAADSAGQSTACTCSTTAGRWCILADVFGAAGNNARDYTPEQEWQSTDDGATWTLINGGLSVSSGILNADTGPVERGDRARHGRAGLRLGDRGGRADLQRLPADRAARVLGGDVSGRVRHARAQTPTRISSATARPVRSIPGRRSAGGDGRLRHQLHQRPAGVLVQTASATAYVYGSGNQSASNNYNISPGPAQQRLAGSGDPGRLQRGDTRPSAAVPSGFGDPRGPPEATSTTVLSPLRRRDDEVRHAAGER